MAPHCTEASKLELAITLLFACAQKHAERQISCLTVVVQVTVCRFGLSPGKWGMANARQDLRPTSIPGSRLGCSTLTCLGQSPYSYDNRNYLAAEALGKSLVPAYTPTQAACSPHPKRLLLLVCFLWRLPGLSSLSKLEIAARKSTEHPKRGWWCTSHPRSTAANLLLRGLDGEGQAALLCRDGRVWITHSPFP